MLRGAIVGFGNVAQYGHWPAYQNNRDAQIVAVVDSTAERRAVARELSLATCETVDELRGLAIDFVDICTPPAHHAAQIIEAIAAGWHVLCEKPLIVNSTGLTSRVYGASNRDLTGEIAAGAAEKNVAVVPVHNWKYAPIIRRATEVLRSGRIGPLRRAEMSVLRIQPAASTGRSWRSDAQLAGGGIVMDHGWHTIYLALNWFGEPARGVQAQLLRSADIETEGTVAIAFSSGSAVISLSWNAAKRENQITLRGDRGEIVIDDDVLRVNGQSEQFAEKLSAGSHHPEWFASMLPDVLAAFREPARARPLFAEAAECLRIIEHAYASA
jgi:predicted dehydrogenase